MPDAMIETRRARRSRPQLLTLEEHLSPEQVAVRLGVSVVTVRRAIKSGALSPVRRCGRRLLVPASASRRFLLGLPLVEPAA